MPTAEMDKELIEREKQYWKALQQRDTATVLELTDFPCLVAGASGVARIDEKTFAKMLENPKYAIQHADLKDVQIQRLTDDIAVVAYKVREELLVEGKPVAFDAADSSTWIRRNGRWACAAHTEAIMGDPFGRDRKPS